MASSAFLTQKGETTHDVKRDIAQLETLLAGAKQASQSTQFLKKKHEMRQVDDALQLMKEEYRQRMEACDERQAQYEQRQAKMREQVAKFEKFIHENDAKRQRAEAKAKQEHKLYESKCREYAELQQKQTDLEREQAELGKKLAKLRKYKEFLDKAIDAGDHGYEEVEELLNRYATLKQANQDLLRTAQENDALTDSLRQELHQYRMEKQNILLVTGSQLNSYQKVLERKRAESSKSYEDKSHADLKAKEIIRESGQVVLAVRNMFARCTARMRQKQPAIQKAQLNELLTAYLEVIHTRIVDAMEIVEEYKLYRDDGSFIRDNGSTIESMGTDTKDSASRRTSRGQKRNDTGSAMSSGDDDRSRFSNNKR